MGLKKNKVVFPHLDETSQLINKSKLTYIKMVMKRNNMASEPMFLNMKSHQRLNRMKSGSALEETTFYYQLLFAHDIGRSLCFRRLWKWVVGYLSQSGL